MLIRQGGDVLFRVTPEGQEIARRVSERTVEEVGAEFARIDPLAAA